MMPGWRCGGCLCEPGQAVATLDAVCARIARPDGAADPRDALTPCLDAAMRLLLRTGCPSGSVLTLGELLAARGCFGGSAPALQAYMRLERIEAAVREGCLRYVLRHVFGNPALAARAPGAMPEPPAAGAWTVTAARPVGPYGQLRWWRAVLWRRNGASWRIADGYVASDGIAVGAGLTPAEARAALGAARRAAAAAFLG